MSDLLLSKPEKYRSTEEQRTVFVEGLYSDYAELKAQNDDLQESLQALDYAAFKSNDRQIHELLFNQKDTLSGELGDWDTYEKVEGMIKKLVYARSSNTQKDDVNELDAAKDRIQVLTNTSLAQQREVRSLQSSVASMRQEMSGLLNVLSLKDREIRTLMSKNNTLSLQLRHLERLNTALKTSYASAEAQGNTIYNDLQLLINANKELERENTDLRTKLYAVQLGKSLALSEDISTDGVDSTDDDGSGLGTSGSFSRPRTNDAARYHDASANLEQDDKRSEYIDKQIPISAFMVKMQRARTVWRKRLEREIQSSMCALDFDALIPKQTPQPPHTSAGAAAESDEVVWNDYFTDYVSARGKSIVQHPLQAVESSKTVPSPVGALNLAEVYEEAGAFSRGDAFPDGAAQGIAGRGGVQQNVSGAQTTFETAPSAQGGGSHATGAASTGHTNNDSGGAVMSSGQPHANAGAPPPSSTAVASSAHTQKDDPFFMTESAPPGVVFGDTDAVASGGKTEVHRGKDEPRLTSVTTSSPTLDSPWQSSPATKITASDRLTPAHPAHGGGSAPQGSAGAVDDGPFRNTQLSSAGNVSGGARTLKLALLEMTGASRRLCLIREAVHVDYLRKQIEKLTLQQRGELPASNPAASGTPAQTTPAVKGTAGAPAVSRHSVVSLLPSLTPNDGQSRHHSHDSTAETEGPSSPILRNGSPHPPSRAGTTQIPSAADVSANATGVSPNTRPPGLETCQLLREDLGTLRSGVAELQDEVTAMLDALREVFANIMLTHQQELSTRGDIEEVFDEVTQEVLAKMAENRALEVLHDEHGIDLTPRPITDDMTDEEWVAEKLRAAVLQMARERVNPPASDTSHAEATSGGAGTGRKTLNKSKWNSFGSSSAVDTTKPARSDSAGFDTAKKHTGSLTNAPDGELSQPLPPSTQRPGAGGGGVSSAPPRQQRPAQTSGVVEYRPVHPQQMTFGDFFDGAGPEVQEGAVLPHFLMRGTAVHPLNPAARQQRSESKWRLMDAGTTPGMDYSLLFSAPSHSPGVKQARFNFAEFLRQVRGQNQMQRNIESLRPTVIRYTLHSHARDRASSRIAKATGNLYGQEFKAFMRDYIAPVAGAATSYATGGKVLDGALRDAVKQLRAEEERRRKLNARRIFQRVVTRIRCRNVLNHGVQHGDAFTSYVSKLYLLWEKRTQRENAQRKREAELQNNRLLDVLGLAPRPSSTTSDKRAFLPSLAAPSSARVGTTSPTPRQDPKQPLTGRKLKPLGVSNYQFNFAPAEEKSSKRFL